MNPEDLKSLPDFLETLGLGEPPMGAFYTDREPAHGFTPRPSDLPTREKEKRDEIDWQGVFGQFSCAMGHIWRARRKGTAAYFDSGHFGCPGAAFWLGFMKPQTETIIHYVSSGVPDRMEGEWYCESPDNLRKIFDEIDPRPAPRKFCVVKPITLFEGHEIPEIVSFFGRAESLCGLHQLAAFVTNDPEVVASPWGAACTGLITWPMRYLAQGKNRAVLGGWDPSARKFFKTDELSFTVSYDMFGRMLQRFKESFLTTNTWQTVSKKIARSRRVWKEGPLEP